MMPPAAAAAAIAGVTMVMAIVMAVRLNIKNKVCMATCGCNTR